MIPSRIAAAFFAALTTTATAATVQAHNLSDGGGHFHAAETQGLVALFADHGWLVLAVAIILMATGLVLRNWKRG